MSIQPNDSFLLDGVRTPFGKYRGALGALSSLDLGQHAIEALIRRQPLAAKPSAALLGVVVQAGLGQNPARIAALRAGVESTSPALTLNSVCLASLEAVCDATRRIRSGEGSHYLVGGFDSMTRAPRLLASEFEAAFDEPRSALHSDGLSCALAGVSMGALSDRYNRELEISRVEQDEWACMSQDRAAAAAAVLRDEIVAVTRDNQLVSADQCVRPNASLADLEKLRPAFDADGTITAGNASQLADGASAGLIVSGMMLGQAERAPLARIVDWGWV
ncbi:MAG: thiolase family protein, partial [Betaproteobacteria bacterium]|nr:thiolase family protein [Betaproteobacteria bacterium]